MANRFRKINHLSEHEFNKGFKILSEPGKERGIGNFGEATEVAQFFTEDQEKDQEGVGGNGKNLLQDKGRKEAGQRIKAFASAVLIESIEKDRRNKLLDIEMFIKKLEKGRGIFDKHILAV